MNKPTTAILAALMLLAPVLAEAGDPAVKCEAGKLKISSKYAACLLKAEASAVTTGGDPNYDKCESKFSDLWGKTEAKAGTGVCPSEGDETAIRDFLDACDAGVAEALAGGALLLDPVTCDGALDACDATSTACGEDLASCEGDLASTNADLGGCQGDLSACQATNGTCGTDLATCQGDLGSCNTDLGATNADLGSCNGSLGTCNTNLGTCTGSLGTCSADLSATNADLSLTNADLASCNSALAACESATCGNGVLEAGELCELWGTETTFSAGATCVSEGFALGELACGPGCVLDTSGCRNQVCGDEIIDAPEQCDDGNLVDDDACDNTCMVDRFVDNGDGTLTDTYTGLMWEKKSDDGDIHDKDNVYTWSTGTPYLLDGTVFTEFLPALNEGGGFAGHTDWRLPLAEELSTICNWPAFKDGAVAGCSATDPACSWTLSKTSGPTYYWTRQPDPSRSAYALAHDADTCWSTWINKPRGEAVRAVRTHLNDILILQHDYTSNDFQTSELAVVGDAYWASDLDPILTPFPNRLRLTDNSTSRAGSAWYTTPIDPTRDWSASYRFQISSPYNGGADGMAFYLQSEGVGANPGLSNAFSTPYMAVHIDTWNNDEGTDESLKVYLSGVEVYRKNLNSGSWNPKPGSSTNVFRIELDYRSGNRSLDIRLIEEGGESVEIWERGLDIDLAGLSDSAWAGFSGATGASAEKHDVRTFEMIARRASAL